MMMIHKVDRKRNRIGSSEISLELWKISKVWMMCMAIVCVCTYCRTLPVQAAPATLRSSDAVVYEQTDEDSSPVGNLVEGSSFEYIGDITAEDGSVWRQITTVGGVTGYIRSDREIEVREEEPEPENFVDENEGEPASAENEPEENGEEAGESTGEAPENGDGETDEDSEIHDEDDGEELQDDAAGINMQNSHIQNNQSKKYILDASTKIKERESAAEIKTGIQQGESKKTGVDMTLIIGMAVILFCTGAVYICLNRMKSLKGETDTEALDAGKSKVSKKTEKKKRTQKRKTKKSGKSLEKYKGSWRKQ